VQTSFQANYSIAFACFLNRWTLLRTSARWTTIHPPDARTSHLRTLSKIFRNRPQRLVPSRHRSARGSRTLYSSFRERQHLFANFLLLPDSPKSFVSEAFHLTGPRILQHVFDSSTLVETAAFRASRQPTNRSAGRASYSNVSDRQHPSKPLLLRVPVNQSTGQRGRALCRSEWGLGRGFAKNEQGIFCAASKPMRDGAHGGFAIWLALTPALSRGRERETSPALSIGWR